MVDWVPIDLQDVSVDVMMEEKPADDDVEMSTPNDSHGIDVSRRRGQEYHEIFLTPGEPATDLTRTLPSRSLL